MTSIQIRFAETRRDLEAIYRFRYSVYVEEMNRPQRYADHAEGRIVDPLDSHGRTIGAWLGGRVVGTIRVNLLSEGPAGEYQHLYELESLSPEERRKVSITTQGMVENKLRGTALSLRLGCAAYRHALSNGVYTDFLDCNAHLVSYFLRLGYRIHRTNVHHPEYGEITILRLATRDFQYLKKIRSPFFKILQKNLEAIRSPVP